MVRGLKEVRKGSDVNMENKTKITKQIITKKYIEKEVKKEK